jgi:hypothetical protein
VTTSWTISTGSMMAAAWIGEMARASSGMDRMATPEKPPFDRP